MNTKLILFFSFTFILSAFIHRDSFNSYFFQDDWFTFKIGQARNIKEFFSFFIPRTDVIYYRPLGMQIPFFIMKQLFGLSPFPYRLMTYITHIFNIILVYFLIYLISKNRLNALISSFLYGTSAVHFLPFYWFSIYSFEIGPTFLFISLILFIVFVNKKKFLFYMLSFSAYFLGILTNEIVFVTPIIMFIFLCFNKRFIDIKYLPPFFLLEVFLLLMRLVFFPPPLSGAYRIGLNKQLLHNLESYFLWSVNWPEEMKAQLVNFYTINAQFIRDFSIYYYIFFSGLVIFILLVYLIPFFIYLFKKNINYKFILIGIIWYLIGLIPVILFQDHSFSYYLPISLVGFFLLTTNLFSGLSRVIPREYDFVKKMMLLVLLLNWTVLTYVSIDFNKKIHWAPRRAKIAYEFVTKVTNESRYITNSGLIYIPDSAENKHALNDQDAFQIIYNNDKIQTVYSQNLMKFNEKSN